MTQASANVNHPGIVIPSDVAARAAEFSGREWVLNKVADWLENGSERFFVITGEPGSGKSTLSAWLAGAGPPPANKDLSARLEKVRRSWDAAHFCIADDKGGSINPTQFGESLALQLQSL